MIFIGGNQYQNLLPGLNQILSSPNLLRCSTEVLLGRKISTSSSSSSGLTQCEESLHRTIQRMSTSMREEISVVHDLADIRKSILLRPPSRIPRGSFLTSCVSASTFDENRFLTPPKESTLRQIRGFKTKRSRRDNEDASSFLKLKDPSHTNDKALKAASSGEISDSIFFSSILKKLEPEEKEKMSMAINSYAAGYNAGKNKEPFLRSLVDGKNAGSEKEKSGFWGRMSHITTILVGVVFLAIAAPMLGIRIGVKFGSSPNEIAPEDVNVTFDDVKGCDEAKQELQEIVDFLKNPEKFSVLGGKLPKGCLLVGPPGTGKTLLARAVAGEATVPFFHSSGSEFDEVLVGQGAKRVRDLFTAAKSKAPCVIFIDEIDSVGSTRTSSVYHPYANQTVNQLLSEMDGFLSSDGVIVLGATNRASDLDKALLRPGRFDSQVVVEKPDMKGRREILELYLSKIKHDFTVDVDILARRTIGFAGADLENLVNTAAIRAAVLGKEAVSMIDFEYSHDRRVMGTDWKSRERSREDLKITAYHEAGHTLVAFYTENSMPLHKVTIMARGLSGGHTAMLPKNDQTHQTKAELLAKMDVSMGGRAAEELIFGKDKVTGGASSDLESATRISELMITKLGMSDKMGLRVIPDPDRFESASRISPAATETIDNEVDRLLNDSYKRASNILKSHIKELHLLADALLLHETLDAEQIKAAIEGKDLTQLVNKPHNRNSNNNPSNKPTLNQKRGIPSSGVTEAKPDVLSTKRT